MCVSRPYWCGLIFALLPALLPAQIGSPGGYPGGQNPPGTGGLGIPFPKRHKKDPKAELESVSGMLRRIQKDQVVVEADDHRILSLKRTSSTNFLKMGNPIKPAELQPGDFVEVEYSADDEGFMTAVNVLWQQDGSAKDRAHGAEPVETSLAKGSHEKDSAPPEKESASHEKDAAAAPSKPPEPPEEPNPADLNAPVKEVKAVPIDADDTGPPVLKRGGSTVHREAQPAPSYAPTPAPELSARNEPPVRESRPPVSGTMRPEEVVIEKAREAAASFLETLPNYYCQEMMTRYHSELRPANWQPIDVISMALVYEHGSETYRNITINGKLTKKNVEDLPGAWSTGEFGSVLADVFSPATAADFEFRRESRTAGRAALMYDFSVEREHSHWQIMVASQLLTPAYKGAVWIDKETNRVLRIEMHATHVPEAFPTDHVEMATDYQFIRFGEREYLVPVHAESLSCQRDSDDCSHNVIDFRNYHKYAGESSITFEK